MRRIVFIMALFLWLPNGYAQSPVWSDYAGLLSAYVKPGEKNAVHVNLVDYSSWKEDARWPRVLRTLEEFDLSGLHSHDERMAFWINAYNIMAIAKVLSHWPIESIRDAGSFFSPVWQQPVAKVAGKVRSLNEIEHKILRPMAEPLIHVAIVCASVSCPDLRMEPYDGEYLAEQLQAQAEMFLNRKNKGLRVDEDGLHVSKIFDWFEEDFLDKDVTTWLSRYRKDIQPSTKIVSYLPYDWQINGL